MFIGFVGQLSILNKSSMQCWSQTKSKHNIAKLKFLVCFLSDIKQIFFSIKPTNCTVTASKCFGLSIKLFQKSLYWALIVQFEFVIRFSLQIIECNLKKTKTFTHWSILSPNLYISYHIEVVSVYPITAVHPIAFMWDLISILSSFHQPSLVSGSSWNKLVEMIIMW